MARKKNLLLYASSEADANARYATRFLCPDPFIFVRTAGGRRIFVMSDLEIDRARASGRAHRVLSLPKYVERARKRRKGTPHIADVIVEVLRELRIRGVVVPENFSAGIVDRLRTRRIGVRIERDPFFPERQRKTPEEVRAIRAAMRATERGLAAAVALLEESRIRKGWVTFEGRRLTADRLREVINTTVFEQGCVPNHTIVAPGKRGCDPHDVGGGPIRAGSPIIIDVFPRSEKTGYFADITRTVVKGTPPDDVKAIYDAVLSAQRMALRMIKHGVRVRDIHAGIHALFEERGFFTGRKNGRMQGFFHGTGHGLGLEIHEAPRIADNPTRLEAGMVVTVEPGLYYYPTGGVRIEDTVLVTRNGIKNLTRFPKTLHVP